MDRRRQECVALWFSHLDLLDAWVFIAILLHGIFLCVPFFKLKRVLFTLLCCSCECHCANYESWVWTVNFDSGFWYLLLHDNWGRITKNKKPRAQASVSTKSGDKTDWSVIPENRYCVHWAAYIHLLYTITINECTQWTRVHIYTKLINK